MISTAAILGPDGAIQQDVACKRCGYNLRGLREDGLCPECATPIGRSVTGDLLRFADPGWVGRVAFGLDLLVFGIVIALLLGCVGGAIGVMSKSTVPLQLVGLVATAINVVGVWCMTTPDPSGIGEHTRLNARRIVRTSMLANVAGSFAATLLPTSSGAQVVVLTAMLLSVVNGLLHLVCEWFKFYFYQSLADRVPEPKLAARARFLRNAYAVALGIGIVGGVLLLIDAGRSAPAPTGFPSPPAPLPMPTRSTFRLTGPGAGATPFTVGTGPLTAVGGVVVAIAGLAALILGLLALILILRLRRVMAAQATLARQTWARAIPPPAPTP